MQRTNLCPLNYQNKFMLRRSLIWFLGLFLIANGLFAGRLPSFHIAEDPPISAPIASCEVPFVGDQIEKKFRSLAEKTNGRFYSAIDRPLMEAIHQVLDENLVYGADLVFVIDHTASMKDDIEEISRELKTIMERVQKAGNVRVGVVSFSDVKAGYEYGYRSLDLGRDFEAISKFLDTIDLVGSVEDIYGAVWRTLDEFSWSSTTKRIIVLIGDEQPATGNETDHTEEDVSNKCRSSAVSANLFPVLIPKED